MYIINEDDIIEVYPFADDERSAAFSGRVKIATDRRVAPDVAGRLQIGIIFPNGATLEDWNKLKEAGDKAFELAAEK